MMHFKACWFEAKRSHPVGTFRHLDSELEHRPDGESIDGDMLPGISSGFASLCLAALKTWTTAIYTQE